MRDQSKLNILLIKIKIIYWKKSLMFETSVKYLPLQLFICMFLFMNWLSLVKYCSTVLRSETFIFSAAVDWRTPWLAASQLSDPGHSMSTVGCFGDCGFGGGGGGHSTEQSNKPKNISVVFHPPIQTILKEKDHAKWWVWQWQIILSEIFLLRYTDMVNELATVGDDPNQFNEYGEAPLCVAADKGLGMVVAELLQRDNIKVNIKGKHGRTPLYIAAEGGHVFIVKCLLRHPSVDVNSR